MKSQFQTFQQKFFEKLEQVVGRHGLEVAISASAENTGAGYVSKAGSFNNVFTFALSKL